MIDKKQAISIADKLAVFCLHMNCAECPFGIPYPGFSPECVLKDYPLGWDVDQARKIYRRVDLSK